MESPTTMDEARLDIWPRSMLVALWMALGSKMVHAMDVDDAILHATIPNVLLVLTILLVLA